ncbi:DUF1566 domain-containing protein [Pleionea sp. CnH1-48]|nr:DUF1566 domain-containing protein [Pleionea sp. CnH1-48]
MAGAGSDQLSGLESHDIMLGGNDQDTYIIGSNSGTDLIIDVSGQNIIRFIDGISFNDIASGLTRSGNNLILRIGSTGNEVQVENFFTVSNTIETIEFETGGSISAAQLFGAFGVAAPTASANSADVIIGSGEIDTLTGSTNANILIAGQGDDTLEGKAGDDYLVGGPGKDTYIIGASNGVDLIIDGEGDNVIHFIDGVTFNDVASGLGKVGDDLVLTVGGSAHKIKVNQFFKASHSVAKITFATGGELSAAQIFAAFGLSQPSENYAINDLLTGVAAEDTDNDGVPDALDSCPSTPAGMAVNASGCADSQLDDDNDGVFNDADQCPNTSSGANVNANGCAESQLDSDNDGVNNALDQCPNTVAGATVNANGCADAQVDSDNDGVNDALDQCPNTASGATVNANGCADAQLDNDNDGVNNALDQCPNTEAGATVNVSGCAESQLDSDNDGVNNALDQCPNTASGATVNANGCAESQLDNDNDGVNNVLDQCPNTEAGATVNANGCAESQLDSDNDGVNNALDQCPNTEAGATVNANGCAESQLDDDNDGVNNVLDQCPNTEAGATVNANGCAESQLDSDNDGVNNALDQCPNTDAGATVNGNGCAESQLDDDNDGVNNPLDQCPNTEAGAIVNTNGCAESQLDDDNDGVNNALDQCPNTQASATVNANGCSESQLNEDYDNDGVINRDDQCPSTEEGATVNENGCAASQLDTDNDGVTDNLDQCASTSAGAVVDTNGCAEAQRDDDNDGVLNGIDQCPDTAEGATIDVNGCAESQITDGMRYKSSLLPKTGADVSYSTLDDADLNWGQDRHYVRSNTFDTVTDTKTGLVWLDNLETKESNYTWTAARDYCLALDYADRDDWRLPTALELLYLLDLSSSHSRDIPKIDGAFANATDNYYWANKKDRISGVDYGDVVHFDLGTRGQRKTSLEAAPRCVSGTQKSEAEYFRESPIYSQANTVTDTVNRIMWQDDIVVKTNEFTFAEALNYCESLELDGSTDWRLPNINELHSTYNNIISTSNPTFKNRPPRTGSSYPYLWSSTTSPYDTDSAYVLWVSPGNAHSYYNRKTSSWGDTKNFVRCVRDYSYPVSVPGGDRSATVGDTISFDGGASYDPDGTVVQYRWYDPDSISIIFGTVTYSTVYSGEQTFESNSFPVGSNNVELAVTDNNGLVSRQSFVVTIVDRDNEAPVANSQAINTNEDESVLITLVATDGDTDPLNYEITEQPQSGAVSLSDNKATYTPNENFSGTDSFKFKVNDGSADSNIATVTINVASVNDAPPVANAGGNKEITLGGVVHFDASESYDEEGIVSYQWSLDGSVLSTEKTFSKSDFGVGQHQVTLAVTDTDGAEATDEITVSVSYPFEQCTVEAIEDDSEFVDSYPSEDISWIGLNMTDVKEIERAFNHARAIDNSVFKFLKMPTQSIWNSWSLQQKGLYLTNSEREARGLKPYEGVSPDVVQVTQNYADYIRLNNEIISHTRSSDGASPADRLNENSTIKGNHEAGIKAENLYGGFDYAETPDPTTALIDAIYRWTYADKYPYAGKAWGHRDLILQPGLKENSGNSHAEGLIGFGVSTGAYDPSGSNPSSLGVVVSLNVIDPIDTWSHSNSELVDTSTAHQCNSSTVINVDTTGIDVNQLKAVSISPSNIVLNVGDSEPLAVTGLFADGTKRDLTSTASFVPDALSVVNVDSGVVTALKLGYASISTQINGIKSNRVFVTVGEPTDISNLAGTFAEDFLEYIPDNGTIAQYDPKAFGLFTGLVKDKHSNPLEGVKVAFHSNPEYGSVLTDSNGRFVIAGHAGKRALVYNKEGYLTIHREIVAASNAWNTLDDVVLLEVDTKLTAIDLNSNTPQVHRSTVITDAFGSRSATIVFNGISSATIESRDGSTRTIEDFFVRATEYELPESMPGELPHESAFTYCSELEIPGVGDDETVTFDKPVTMYVDNFLNFRVGEIVPIGYYDRNATDWKASDNGVVVKLLDSNNDGLVDGLDYTGDDIADDINKNGSTTDEVIGIENFTPGDTYWRGSFNHFTPWDYNWPWAPGAGSTSAGFPYGNTNGENPNNNENACVSSYINLKPQALHEDIEITGTDLTLHYSSQRTDAYHHKIEAKVSGDTISSTLIEMIAVLEIGGHRFEQKFAPQTNKDVEFMWDGRDAKGNVLRGSIPGRIRIGYRYPLEYMSAGNAADRSQALDEFANAWAQVGSEVTAVRGRQDFITWTDQKINVFGAPESHIAEGWSVSNHHTLAQTDNQSRTKLVYRGDGDSEYVVTMANVLNTGITHSIVTGDDGYYQDDGKDIDYVVDADGVLIDKVTGLEWQYISDKPAAFTRMVEASAYCRALNIGDTSTFEWRLPTAKERAYTIDKSNTQKGARIYQTDALSHWTSSTSNEDEELLPVVCVKGQTIDSLYVEGLKRDDVAEVVTDEQNGLMWQDTAANASNLFNWTGAINYCESLTHAGFDDWRLPNVNELLYTLPNSVFVNQTTLDSPDPWFPNVDFRKPYWSSTINVEDESQAWAVESLSYAYPGYAHSDTYNVRCVRDDLASASSPYVFDQDGKHIKTIDVASGVTLTTFNYDDQGRLIFMTDRFNNKVTIHRDAEGKATSIESPDGYITTLVVDVNNDLGSAKYADGNAYIFTYDNHLMTQELDKANHLFTREFDVHGRIKQSEDPEGGIWSFYNIKDDFSKIVEYGYSTAESSRYFSKESQLSEGDTQVLTTYKDKTEVSIVRNKEKLRETYVDQGVTTIIDMAIDPKTKLEIPKTVSTKLPSGLESVTQISKSYGLNGQVSKKLSVEVNTNGNLFEISDDFTTGERTSKSAEGRVVVEQFNPINRLLESEQVSGFHATEYGYDSRGRLVASTTGDRTTTFLYDDNKSKGSVTSIINAMNQETSFDYDELGRLVKTTFHDGSEISQDYDANGNLASIQPPGQPVHRFNYNSVGRETQYTPPIVDGVTIPETTYEYDKDRKLTRILRPDGSQLLYRYKANTELLGSMEIPRGIFEYKYNSHGNLTNIATPEGNELIIGYDGDLLTQETWSGDVVGDVSLIYNNNFLISEQCVNSTHCVSLSYDKDNLLTGVGELSFTREVQRLGLQKGSSLGNIHTSQNYTNYGEVSDFSAKYNDEELYKVYYSFDKLGRISNKTETIFGVTSESEYSYDDVGRLKAVNKDNQLTSYSYDNNGNRLSRVTGSSTYSGQYDEQDRVKSYADYTYSYTKNGEVLQKTNTSSDEVTNYRYDVLGNLLSVEISDGSNTDLYEYIVDGANRRIGKKINGVTVQKFIYANELNPIAELDADNKVVSRYVYGEKVNVPEFIIKNGATYRVISDHLGSPRLVVNSQTGVVVQRLDYDEFGNLIADSNPGFQPFGFAGGIYDHHTKLVRFGARDYDPFIGRWMAKDPILFEGQDVNLYKYIFSDPVNLIDPTGEAGPLGFVIGAALDFGIQMLMNGGDITKVDFGDVIVSGVIGAVAPSMLVTGKNLRNLKKRHDQINKRMSEATKQKYIRKLKSKNKKVRDQAIAELKTAGLWQFMKKLFKELFDYYPCE